jgi:hypothetical protein
MSTLFSDTFKSCSSEDDTTFHSHLELLFYISLSVFMLQYERMKSVFEVNRMDVPVIDSLIVTDI